MPRDFKGIWIPRELWFDKNLTTQEKLFYLEIDSLDMDNGCFASNPYFSEFFGISTTRVSIVINSLVKKGYVNSVIEYKKGTKQILKRVLNISYRPYLTNVKAPMQQKLKPPIQQKLKDKNTVINKTSNNTIKEEAKTLSKLLFDLHVKNIDSGFTKTESNLISWAKDIDKINRIDGRPWEQIESVIKWTKGDSFWSGNVMSGKKLREKFDRLVAESKKKQKGQEKKDNHKRGGINFEL